MTHLDHFFDTKEKRQCIFHILYIVLSCLLVFTYLRSAYSFISLDTYDALFASLTSSAFNGCYLSRFVLLSMSMVDIQVLKMIENLCLSFRFIDIAFLIMVIIVCFDQSFQKERKKNLWIPALYIGQFFIVIIMAVIASNGTSLMEVIFLISCIGWGILCIQLLILAMLLLFLRKEIKAYQFALQYDVIEVTED